MPLDQVMLATYLARIAQALELIATRLEEKNGRLDQRLEQMTDADTDDRAEIRARISLDNAAE